MSESAIYLYLCWFQGIPGDVNQNLPFLLRDVLIEIANDSTIGRLQMIDKY